MRCHHFRYGAPQPRKCAVVGLGKSRPMSENCVTLNVIAPDTKFQWPLSVMVYGSAPRAFPKSAACIELGGDFTLGSVVRQIADAHSSARRGVRVPL